MDDVMCDLLAKRCGELFDIEAIKFGKFTVKSGFETPVYFDLRVVVSYPKIMNNIAELIWQKAKELKLSTDLICGVPYTALPIATCISVSQNIPMVLRRKEAKSYGTKQLLEGSYKARQRCMIIEDVVTTGSSVLETVTILRSVGLEVTDCIVLLDREQGGKENLQRQNINLYSVYTMTTLLSFLNMEKKIDKNTINTIQKFIAENNNLKLLPEVTGKKTIISHSNRALLCTHPVTKRLLQIMEKKKTNLCLAVDVVSFSELLWFAEKIGPNICLLKTHIDILKDFNFDDLKKLKNIAKKEEFLIFEDRKFADIGNTVQLQYTAGNYEIKNWANLVTIHHLPGDGIIQALEKVADLQQNGCLIVAEMSSDGSFTTNQYAQAAVKLANNHSDFVVGFISQSKLSFDPKFLRLTPGVQITEGRDQLGQKYITPESAITERGADIIIVGRGITAADTPLEMASVYQKIGYEAYLKTLPTC